MTDIFPFHLTVTTKKTVLIPNFPLASVYCYFYPWWKIHHKQVAVFEYDNLFLAGLNRW